MSVKAKKYDKLVESFKKAFPKAWAKPGRDFDGSERRVIWTVDEEGFFRAFDMYAQHDLYQFGVHQKLVDWAEKNGLFFEAYDNETFMAYEI